MLKLKVNLFTEINHSGFKDLKYYLSANDQYKRYQMA